MLTVVDAFTRECLGLDVDTSLSSRRVTRKLDQIIEERQPGKPMQNGRVESFNGRFRDECLNTTWFHNLADAREEIAGWRREYNGERPHSRLGYRTLNEYAETLKSSAMNR